MVYVDQLPHLPHFLGKLGLCLEPRLSLSHCRYGADVDHG